MTFSPTKKWLLTVLSGLAALIISFCTAAWSGMGNELHKEFAVSDEVITLGISLFLIGFSTGPLIWAPLSELYGRQLLYAISFGMITVFNAGVAGAGNIQTLLILRFFGGAFGVSVMTNSGGTVADLWGPAERGKAVIVMSAPAFMAPVLAVSPLSSNHTSYLSLTCRHSQSQRAFFPNQQVGDGSKDYAPSSPASSG